MDLELSGVLPSTLKDTLSVRDPQELKRQKYRDKWAPFMFMSMLSIFWGIPVVMTPLSCVRISILGPTKLRVSLTDQGWHVFKSKCRELSHAIGISFKDSSTRQSLKADDTTRPTTPSDCNTSDVSTAYIVDVPHAGV